MKYIWTAMLFSISAAFVAPAHAEGSPGLGINVAPKYEGGSVYRVLPLPLVNYKKGHFFVNDLSTGVRFPLGAGFSTGLMATVAFGRDEDDADRLAGTDEIKITALLGGFVDWQHGPWSASVKVLQATHSGYGLTVRAGGAYTAALTPKDVLRVGMGTTWGNNGHMSTYFGVTDAEAMRSNGNLTPYAISSGFKSVDANVAWIHHLNKNWSTVASVGVKTLVGDAADSPIVEKRTAVLSTVGVKYRF
ncbi:outer membrane protein [Burkholderia ambifaria]|nr:MipA/OmpV family protein [Burkholderia ambifaria]MDR6503949.1 outer membrane protein [Burkholderia ambifaria]